MNNNNNNNNNNNEVNRRQKLDYSQILIEIQLKLIYYLELFFAFLKARTAYVWRNECSRTFKSYLTNSFLFSIFFQFQTYLLNNAVRRKRLLEWLHDKLLPPFTPNDFAADWRDGIRLCALCEVIAPGACPRYDLLSPSNAHNNIQLALNMIQAYLNVKPNITAKEIFDCSSEAKLVRLLSQVRIAYAKRLIKSTSSSWFKTNASRTSAAAATTAPPIDFYAILPAASSEFFFNRCALKGMGLVCGVRGRRSSFSIFFREPLPKIGIIFEIIGPYESFCSGKVSIGDDEAMNHRYDDDDIDAEDVSDGRHYEQTQALIMRAAMLKKATSRNLKIPFFYKIFDDHIFVTYIPLFVGNHVVSIICHGQHVLYSPYTIPVEESDYLDDCDFSEIGPKFQAGVQYPLCLLKSHQDCPITSMGTVVSTKVVKKSIVVNGKEFDHDTYFDSNYTHNFLLQPGDPQLWEYLSRKTFSSTPNTDTTPKVDENRQVLFESNSSSSTNLSAELSWALFPRVERPRPPLKRSSTISSNEMRWIDIPKIKIDHVNRDEDDDHHDHHHDHHDDISHSPPIGESKDRIPLKDILEKNSKQFNDNIEKMKRSLKLKLNRYKNRLETDL